MSNPFTPPAGRDLPPASADAMRARLLADIVRPRRPVARRVGVGLALAGIAVIAGVGLSGRPGEDSRQLLALGPEQMPPSLRAAAQQCLEMNDQHDRIPATTADVAVGAQRGDHVALLFLTRERYLACQLWNPPYHGPSGGMATAADGPDWHRDWLPGPVDRLLLTSTEADGGEVVVIGRVSARVHRLVLEHGDGQTTLARIANGAFGLIAQGDVNKRNNPQLVSYDSQGNEIDRRPLFVPFDQLGRCYVDPAGTLIYGLPGPACQPAEPWSH